MSLVAERTLTRIFLHVLLQLEHIRSTAKGVLTDDMSGIRAPTGNAQSMER